MLFRLTLKTRSSCSCMSSFAGGQGAHVSDIHLVVPAFHEAREIVVHVVEDHVDAALHVVYLVGCNKISGSWLLSD